MRLVCFPHAGGAATYYFPMSQAFTPRIEVSAMQYPGRQDRRHEAFVGTVDELADRVFAVLRDGSDRPFAFFGHSMGAVLAFEVAQRFERHTAQTPVHLFVSGRGAPSRYRGGTVHTRTDKGILDELRRIGGTDERFLADPELVATVLGVTRNDYRAVETYSWRPQAPLSCPITALVGDADPQATVPDAGGWSDHTTGPFDLRVFPGGHFYLDRQRARVVETITAALDRVTYVHSTEGALGEV
jgi:pyochelin biosynthetic protein PchC